MLKNKNTQKSVPLATLMTEGSNDQRDKEYRKLVELYEQSLNGRNSSFFASEEFEDIIQYYMESDAYDKALQVIDFACSQHPYNKAFLLNKAQILLFKERANEAVSLLEELALFEPSSAEVSLLLGNAYDELEQYKEAIEKYTRAVEQGAEPDEAFVMIAYCYEGLDDYGMAIESLKQALRFNPGNFQALNELAFCCDFSNEATKSLNFLSRFVDAQPYSYMGWYCLGVVLNKLDRRQEALNAFEYAALIKDDYIPAHLNKGNIHFQEEQYEDAIASFHRILSINKDDLFSLTYIANCYRLMERPDKAKRFFRKALEIDAESADVWYGLGCTYQLEEDHKQAVQHLKKAIKLEEQHDIYWYSLAESYAALEESELALQAFYQVLELDGSNAEYWVGLASFLRDEGCTQEAITALEGALDLIEEPAQPHYWLAGLLMEQGLEAEAVYHLQLAHLYEPEGSIHFYEAFPQFSSHPVPGRIFQ